MANFMTRLSICPESTPLLNIEITLEGPPTHFQLIFKSLGQNQSDQTRKIKNSSLAFFVNPLEGTDHSLKTIAWKIQHHIYFKDFSKVTTFMLDQKKVLLKS